MDKKNFGEKKMTSQITLPKKIPVVEIQTDLKSIELELKEAQNFKGKKLIQWAKDNPEKCKKINDVARKYEIQWAIETLEELLELVKERLGPEERMCEAILRRAYYKFPDC